MSPAKPLRLLTEEDFRGWEISADLTSDAPGKASVSMSAVHAQFGFPVALIADTCWRPGQEANDVKAQALAFWAASMFVLARELRQVVDRLRAGEDA